jgi:hypothetical protein
MAPSLAAAADITAIGAQMRLTNVGPDGNTSFFARDPAIAYNSVDDEFLVAWTGRDPAAPTETEIYGRVLDGTGAPKGTVRRLSTVDGTTAPQQPVLGYSPTVNQYLLVYTGPPPDATNNPAGQREVIAQVVSATGAPSGNSVRISDTDPANVDADSATDPALAYDAEHDQYRIVWVADGSTEGDFEVFSRRVSSSLIDPDNFNVLPISSTPAGDTNDPTIAYLPAQDRYAIAWTGATAVGQTEIFLEVIGIGGGPIAAQAEISTAGSNSASKPSIAADADTNEVLVSFLKNDVVGEGPEVFTQRVNAAGAQVPNATDTRISTMGPPNNVAFGANSSRSTTTTYHPLLKRYLVTWAADNDSPGLVDNEIERYGQAIDSSGSEVGSDDFRVSTAGPDGNAAAGPDIGQAATAPTTRRRVWLHVWAADDNRPPLADGEFETYGRLVGDDGDLDGFTVPSDCNDANAAIHPGATETVDNGIDEDCSGADAENPDRDADGSPRPADCNDSNAAIRPGVADIPSNGVDEDCSGADAVPPPVVVAQTPPGRVNVTLSFLFPSAASSTRFTVLQVKGVPSGSTVVATCKGKGCPTKKVKGKKQNVVFTKKNASGTINLTPFRNKALRAGAVLTVTVTKPGSFGMVKKLTVKKNKKPVLSTTCLQPNSTTAKASCVN